MFKDADGNLMATMVIDAKQLNSKGVVLAKDGAGATMQMSDDWFEVVLSRLPADSAAKKAIVEAQANGTLTKAVAYVDKNGNLNLVKVDPKPPTPEVKKPEAPSAPLKPEDE